MIDGIAVVQRDGSLRLDGRTVRLYGVWIPTDRRTCSSVTNPPRCGPSAAIILDNKIDGFVSCNLVRRLRDGSYEGICGIKGDDLFGPPDDIAALMIQDGWALAKPDGPPEYTALQQLAQAQRRGLWSDGIVRLR